MKKLLLSTALVAATSMPVFAQGTDNMFRQEASPQEIHASEFIGMSVYRSDAADAEEYEGVQDDWDNIGEINDVVFNREGQVEAVLVDIGGFLGIGANQVAVDMNAIRFVADSATPDEESDYFLVLNAPRGALEEAPTYDAARDAGAAGMETADTADTGTMTETDAETAEAGDAVTTEGAAETDMAATTDDTADTDVAVTTTDDTTAPAAGGTDGQMTEGTGLAREGYTTAAHGELAVEDLTGATAYDINDERVGDVADLLMAEDGKIQAAIVDIGGFLGIGAKSVALELSELDILRSEDGSDVRVYVSMTEEELEALPEYER